MAFADLGSSGVVARRAVAILLVSSAALALTGCRAQLDAHLEVKRDGSSEFTLAFYADKRVSEVATKVVGRPLIELLDLEPLTSTGWVIRPQPLAIERPSWANESLALSIEIEDPSDISATLGSIKAAGLSLFDGFEVHVADQPHAVLYSVHGTIRLPPLSTLLPPLPKALSEVAYPDEGFQRLSPQSTSPHLELHFFLRLPAQGSAVGAGIQGDTYVWQIGLGQEIEVVAEAEISKARRLGFWAASAFLMTASVVFYMAARRRSASMSLSK